MDSRERVIAQIKINSQEIEHISYRILDVSDAAQKSFRYDHLTNELVAVGSLVPGHIYKVCVFEYSDDKVKPRFPRFNRSIFKFHT